MEIEKILRRGFVDVISRENLKKKLRGKKKLRVKFGIDPTGAELHLGHAVPLKKLQQLQNLGHKIILLFGGFTATIGDPTGKNSARPPLTADEVEKNSEKYLEMAGKILDISKCEIRNNRDWLEKMDLKKFIKMAAQFSASKIFERDMFKERLKKGKSVELHELLYPILVAFDSVELRADVEIGGTDQLFNLLCGRPMQKFFGQPQQEILTVPILEGLDGTQKMSKSLKNYISLADPPDEIFGKIMSLPDKNMEKYFEIFTEIDEKIFKNEIKKNPRDAKILLGKKIVDFLHDEKSGEIAAENFRKKFAEKKIPENLPEFFCAEKIGILDLISKIAKFAPSNSAAKKLVEQRAVAFSGEKIFDPKKILEIAGGEILQVGRKKFAKILRKK